MFRLIIICIFLLPISIIGQTIIGKIYDKKTTAKNVKVINLQKNLKTYSNTNGVFQISADIGDSIAFNSIFYVEKTIVVSKEHMNQTIVIELDKKVNKLNEVLLSETYKEIPFKAYEYEANFKTQLENDRKNRPYLYNSYNSSGINFIAIGKLIGKLFKRKNKPKPIKHITYKQLDSFFKKDDYFNEKLLKEDLNINKNHRFLFFDYCEARGINKTQIQGNNLILLDTLLSYSEGFHKIITTKIED